jgi:cytochrome c-type biogenesis protein
MINSWLEALSIVIQNNIWLAPLVALVAGVLTSVMPCALSSVPLVIGYVGGTGSNNTKRAFQLSLTFAFGMAVTFTTLGVIASMLGKLMGTTSPWWYLALGVLMLLMALQIFEVYNFIPATHLIARSTKRGFIGALIAGVLGGVFSSPCATPVLVVLLGIVARSGNLAWGVLLLLLYSVGHSVLVLVAGTSVGFVQKLTVSNRYGTISNYLKYSMGTVLLLISFYMFYLGF